MLALRYYTYIDQLWRIYPRRTDMAPKERTGTIVTLVTEKGFGFIRYGDGHEVFFHKSGLIGINFDHLERNLPVRFEIVASPKGPRAENVRADNVQAEL